MTTIVRAQKEEYTLLAEIGVPSFLTAHRHSATPEVVDAYLKEKYSTDAFRKELADIRNIYHMIYYDNTPVGYSKIILDAAHPDIEKPNVTKLERLYVLKEFFGKHLGAQLVQFNIDLAKANGQEGMWLHVWIENARAVAFYKKMGFQIIGAYNFLLSGNHYNPNHHMYLEF